MRALLAADRINVIVENDEGLHWWRFGRAIDPLSYADRDRWLKGAIAKWGLLPVIDQPVIDGFPVLELERGGYRLTGTLPGAGEPQVKHLGPGPHPSGSPQSVHGRPQGMVEVEGEPPPDVFSGLTELEQHRATPVLELANSDPTLETKRQLVLLMGQDQKDAARERLDVTTERLKEISRARERTYEQIRAVGFASEEAKQLREEMDRLLEEYRPALMEQAQAAIDVAVGAVKLLEIPQRERVKIPLERSGGSQFWLDRRQRSLSMGFEGNEGKRNRAKFVQATALLQSLTRKSIDPNLHEIPVQIHDSEEGVRGMHVPVPAGTSGRGSAFGVFVARKDPMHVHIHELAHHIETMMPAVKRRTNEFRKARVERAGTPDILMHEEFPEHNYDASENGNKDDFENVFPDVEIDERIDEATHIELAHKHARMKERRAHYTGKTYAGGHTEILSVGVEWLFRDPIGFAERDPEFWKFIVGVLDGTIR